MSEDRQAVEEREREFFAGYYAGETRNPAGEQRRRQRELRTLLRASGRARLGRVLSIGCGDGRFELELAAHADSVVGIDISPEGIENARSFAAEEGVANVEFRCLPVAELPWQESFDAILCLAFLHHVPEPELLDLLRQMHRHVAVGGFLYAQDPNRGGVLRSVGRVLMGANYDRYHSPDERELDPKEMRELLAQAGFDEVSIGYNDVTLTPLHYLVPRGPAWLMAASAGFDRAWCASPLAPWASGFTMLASRAR